MCLWLVYNSFGNFSTSRHTFNFAFSSTLVEQDNAEITTPRKIIHFIGNQSLVVKTIHLKPHMEGEGANQTSVRCRAG